MSDRKIPRDREDDYSEAAIKARQEFVAEQTGVTPAHTATYSLDPAALHAAPEALRAEVGRVLDSYAAGNGGSRDGHVFNLGHGITPDVDPERVAVLLQAVHELSRR